MTDIEHQDIILYPAKRIPQLVLLSIVCLFFGVALPFFSKAWQVFLALLGSLFFIMCGIWIGPITLWRRVYHPQPLLIINAEGMSRHGRLLRWAEIDSIYRTRVQNHWGFGVDITPEGVIAFSARYSMHLPRGRAITQPQQALAISAINLPIPVDDLLARIHEQFSEQLARFHIECQRG